MTTRTSKPPTTRKPRQPRTVAPPPAVPARCRPTDPDGGFDALLPILRDHFDAAVADTKQPIFRTDAGNLYDTFLLNLPTELRKHYECRCCRHFVKRYGGLVRVADDGTLVPIMWALPRNYADAPVAFRSSLAALHCTVANANIIEVFLSDSIDLGNAETAGTDPVTGHPVTWHHFHGKLPAARRYTSLVKSVDAAIAETREERAMLQRGLVEFGPDVVQKALAMLTSGSFDRPEKGEPMASWLLQQHRDLAKFKGRAYDNRLWYIAATAPTGFCRVRSGILGTLLEDVVAGFDVKTIARRWAEKVDPTQYMRAQVAPAAGNLKRAEEIIARMEAAGALQRRYAVKADVAEFVWQPHAKAATAPVGGVFGHITPKQKTQPAPTLDLPEVKMTWEKFQRTMLASADRIEYAAATTPAQMAALVTAADPTAPPILQWDADDRRNPVSVYSQQAAPTTWNLQPGFVDVDFISTMPYQWHGAKHGQHKPGVLLALQGCRDVNRKQGGGFLPEFLRSDFHEIRSSLDAYAKSATIAGAASAECCGIALMNVAGDGSAAVTPTTTATRELLVLDESGSMGSHLSQMNRQTETIRAELANSLPNSLVEICRFGDRINWERAVPARSIRSLVTGAHMSSTALYAAVQQAAQRAMQSTDAVLIYIFTDGEDNSSNRVGADASTCRQAVAAALATGRITFACIGPATSARFFESCGIPSGCVRFWSGRSIDLDQVTTEVSAGLRAYSAARAAGRSSIDDFFTAPTSGFGNGVRLRVTSGGQRQVVVLDRWD